MASQGILRENTESSSQNRNPAQTATRKIIVRKLAEDIVQRSLFRTNPRRTRGRGLLHVRNGRLRVRLSRPIRGISTAQLRHT
jgi:hypothetical protein